MKHVTLFLLAIITMATTTVAQDTKNFKIVKEKLVWQKVFETELTEEEIIESLKKTEYIDSVKKIKETTYSAIIVEMPLDFRDYGLTSMGVPMYIARSDLLASVTIDIKPGKYRVTISSMTLRQRYTDPLTMEGQKTDLQIFALKKGNTQFKSMFLGNASSVINYTINKAFTLKKVEKEAEDDNW